MKYSVFWSSYFTSDILMNQTILVIYGTFSAVTCNAHIIFKTMWPKKKISRIGHKKHFTYSDRCTVNWLLIMAGHLPCQKEHVQDRHEGHKLEPSRSKEPQNFPAHFPWKTGRNRRLTHKGCNHWREWITEEKGLKNVTGQTNLGQLPASRTARAASETLSQRQNPTLCLHSPHSGPAAGDKNLEEQNAEREFHYNTCGARRRARNIHKVLLLHGKHQNKEKRWLTCAS